MKPGPEIYTDRVKLDGSHLGQKPGAKESVSFRSFLDLILHSHQKLSCLKSGVEFDMSDIFYEFKYLHHFYESLKGTSGREIS